MDETWPNTAIKRRYLLSCVQSLNVYFPQQHDKWVMLLSYQSVCSSNSKNDHSTLICVCLLHHKLLPTTSMPLCCLFFHSHSGFTFTDVNETVMRIGPCCTVYKAAVWLGLQNSWGVFTTAYYFSTRALFDVNREPRRLHGHGEWYWT